MECLSVSLLLQNSINSPHSMTVTASNAKDQEQQQHAKHTDKATWKSTQPKPEQQQWQTWREWEWPMTDRAGFGWQQVGDLLLTSARTNAPLCFHYNMSPDGPTRLLDRANPIIPFQSLLSSYRIQSSLLTSYIPHALLRLDYGALIYEVFPSSGSSLIWSFLLGIPLPHLCNFTSYPSSLSQIHLGISFWSHVTFLHLSEGSLSSPAI